MIQNIIALFGFIFNMFDRINKKKVDFLIRYVDTEDKIWITNRGEGEAKNLKIEPLCLNTAIYYIPSPILILSSKNSVKLQLKRDNYTPMQEIIKLSWIEGKKTKKTKEIPIYY